MVENIYLKKFAFILKAEEEISLPGYKGSAFRGAFGWAFRHTVCVTKAPECTGCLFQNHCLYFKYFETEVQGHAIPFLKGVTRVPHPFVIHPPLDNAREYRQGSLIEVQLSLFGSASEYLPYFIHAFIKLGDEGLGIKRQKVLLDRVEAISATGLREEVYDPLTGRIKATGEKIIPAKMVDSPTGNTSCNVRLKFLTPVRFQSDGKTVMNKTHISPELLLANITRRCVAVSCFYCGGTYGKPDLTGVENIGIAENHLRFYEWSRYSNRQQSKMQMGGFVGSLELSDVPPSLLPYFVAGSFLGIGKHTMFGMGKYVLL